MATPLVTTQILTITNAELQRGNAALTQVETLTTQVTSLTTQNVALQASVAAKDATITQKNARIAELEALLAQQPPPTTPPPVTPTVPVPGLFVKNGKLYTKKGVEFVVRGIESMFDSDAYQAGPVNWVKTQKALGCNTISPIWKSSQTAPERIKLVLDAARAEGLIVGFNSDETGFGRDWLCTKPIVDLCNSYDNIFLECEVETGWGQTAQQWVDDVKGLVKALRDAGHKHPIKVGSPAGGRVPLLPIQNGKQVVDFDPLKNVCFTWQSYWHKVAPAGSWHYQQESEVPVSASDPGGAIEQCKRIRESGLCFIIGIDKVDDVGTTIYREVLAEADKYGLSVQHWVLFRDFRKDNEMLGDYRQTIQYITATGAEIRDLFKAKMVPAVL